VSLSIARLGFTSFATKRWHDFERRSPAFPCNLSFHALRLDDDYRRWILTHENNNSIGSHESACDTFARCNLKPNTNISKRSVVCEALINLISYR